MFEALPSSVLQIYALLLAEEKSTGALISILVSAATIAFTSSMLSYDWDTSPAKRKLGPLFYGYVPDKALARAVCFISMMSLAFSHVLLLTFSCALLSVTKSTWLLYFLGLDIGLFFVYKIVARDFYYFVNLEGIERLIASLTVRFVGKIFVSKNCTLTPLESSL